MSPSPAKNIEVTSSFIQVGRPPGKSAASSQISVCWYAGEARAMWSPKKRKAKENYLSLFWNSFKSSRTFSSGLGTTSRFHLWFSFILRNGKLTNHGIDSTASTSFFATGSLNKYKYRLKESHPWCSVSKWPPCLSCGFFELNIPS